MTGKSALEFCFELDGLEDIEPWETCTSSSYSSNPRATPAGRGDHLGDEQKSLHWFGLTSGRYWISTPLGEALRYTKEEQCLWQLQSPYVDYQVARLFEDIQGVLPLALEPVPPDIAAIVSDSGWYARSKRWLDAEGNDDDSYECWYYATQWWHERSLDTAYLVSGPYFHVWRTENEVSIRWHTAGEDARSVWVLPEGQFSLDVKEFEAASYLFFERVLTAMEQTVESIRKGGWQRTDCHLDVTQLVTEQQRRVSYLNELKNRHVETDWNRVRTLLRELSAKF